MKVKSHNITSTGFGKGKRYDEKEQRRAVKLMQKLGVVEASRQTGASITSLYNWQAKFAGEKAEVAA